MDLHLSTDKVVSLKDAFLRYAVIVAGILTALGLNQWVESRQHARQGAQALSAIEAELSRNRVVLGKSLKALQAQRQNFLAAEKVLGENSFDVPDLRARARTLLDDNSISLDFAVSLAALQHSAWDAAVASQSIQYLPAERQIALARIYALIGEIAGTARTTATSEALLGRAASADMFIRGESTDALRLARSIREQGFTIALLDSLYGLLQQQIGSTLAGDATQGNPGAEGAAPAATGQPSPARP